MFSNSQQSKIYRKQKRCLAIISKETGIEGSDLPTEFIGICNAGLSTGLQEEILLQEALKYGKVDKIFMIPNKSYCFMKTFSNNDSTSIYNGMNGKSKIGQNNGIVYLAYFNDIPKIETECLYISNENDHELLPSGLIIIKDFVCEKEEEIMMKVILSDDDKEEHDHGSLKYRIVKHYGYEFLYGTNQVDPDKPLKRKIPEEFDFIWNRIREKFPNSDCWWCHNEPPDQLTVNHYSPGQGIPSHVDTHSAFLDPLVIISLEDDIIMEFKHHDNNCKKLNVIIPQRSLLVMSKESRYDWKHGITPRNMDIIRNERSGGLTIKQRTNRTSLTFRKLRRGPCICNYPKLCDTFAETLLKNSDQKEIRGMGDNEKIDEKLKMLAEKLEIENVHKVYDEIAGHFNKTRHSPWPKVSEFLNSFDTGSTILDVGCGNGKYLTDDSPTHLAKIGCDRSEKLLNVCRDKNFNVFRCDCLSLPFRDDCIDGCISIAVIHHLATQERRLQAIQEMIRILRKNGKCLIYVWAKNQKVNNKKSNYLRQGDRGEAKSEKMVNGDNFNLKSDVIVELPVHVNRTEFEQQDVFVPWKLKDKNCKNSIPKIPNNTTITTNTSNSTSSNNETFLRYYHVFDENELENLCKTIDNIEIVKSYYDEGNWCIILRKI